MQQPSDSLPAGTAVGAYRVLRELGRGGMATVYLARDLKHDRAVALKLLHVELAAELGTERFLREIRLAAQLHHPHILPLYDSGTTAGGDSRSPSRPFYTMPYVEGESLRARLDREARLPLDDAVRIAREVAGALHHAHRRGIVHRDIKPENILLEDDQALITDFGIARAISVAGEERLTATGLIVGTPAYMSPEQVAGETELDGRTDIYSLGCVLFEMLAGEPPFTGPSAQANMCRRCIERAPRVRSFRADLPEWIDDAVDRALAQTPSGRFPTAAALAEALGGSAAARPGLVPSEHHAIAVLPFVNLSPDPENEYFSDGMTEELTTALARVPRLRVASRSSAFAFKGKDIDARAIGQRLMVDSLIQGTVRKIGNRIRLTAQLVHVADGYQRWSQTFDRVLEDVFDLQEELSRAIAAALPLGLTGGVDTLVAPATENLEAYTLFLRGRYFANKRTLESLEAATGYFEQAVARDPAYASAYTGLAECWNLRSIVEWGHPGPREALPRAKAAALKALELEPDSSEARGWLAAATMLYDWEWALAEIEFRRATESQAENSRAHLWYAIFLGAMGRDQESISRILRAQALDPLSLPIHQTVARCYVWAAKYDLAIEQLQTTREMEPRHPLSYGWMARALCGKGMFREALEELAQGMVVAGRQPLLLALTGQAHGELGMRAEALAMVEELRQASTRRYVSPFLEALVRGSLGDLDEAFRLYDVAYEQRASDFAFMRVSHVCLPERTSAICADPRFAALLKRLKLDGEPPRAV
jgi:serine/threonine-protein kinase